MNTGNRREVRWNTKRRDHVLQSALSYAGFRSVYHACVVSGVHPTRICNMINGRESPFCIDGHLRNDASNFLDVLCETPGRIFPGCDNAYLNFYAIEESQARRTAARRRKMYYTLNTLIGCLNQWEHQIIILRFYENMVQTEIASVMNISQTRVRQILEKAFRRMRRHALRRHLTLSEIFDN